MRVFDPHLIADRWAVTLPEDAEPDGLEDPGRAAWRASLRKRLTRALVRLPWIEAEVLHMHAQGMLQVEIGECLGITQAAVSHRLGTAQARLRILVALPDLDARQVAETFATLQTLNMPPHIAAVLRDYWHTCNISATARRLGRSRVWTHKQVVLGMQGLRRMVGVRPELKPLVAGLEVLRANPALLGNARARSEPAQRA